MKSKRLIGLLLYTALPVWAFSQIKGTIVDIHQQPVEGATIVMQLPDSTYLEATISAADGTFMLKTGAGELSAYCPALTLSDQTNKRSGS